MPLLRALFLQTKYMVKKTSAIEPFVCVKPAARSDFRGGLLPGSISQRTGKHFNH